MSLNPIDLQIALIQVGMASKHYLATSKTSRKNQLNREIKAQNKSQALNTQIQESPDNIDISLNVELEPQHKTSDGVPARTETKAPRKHNAFKTYNRTHKENTEDFKGTYIDVLE